LNTSICPICNHTISHFSLNARDIIFGTEVNYEYLSCRGCEHLWLHPKFNLDLVGFNEPNQDFILGVMNHPFVNKMLYLPRIRWLANRISLDKSKEALDIGCGTGTFIRLLRQMYGCKCDGIDSDSIFTQYQTDPDINVQITSFEELKTEKLYDLITMFHLIEHLTEPRSAIQKAIDMLKPGGYLCLETPASDSIAFRIFKNNWFPLLPPYHRHIFSRKSLNLLIGELSSAQIVEFENVYISGEFLVSASLPLVRYAPHPFQKRHLNWLQKISSSFGIFSLFFITLPAEIFIAGTLRLMDVASHQRILIHKRASSP